MRRSGRLVVLLAVVLVLVVLDACTSASSGSPASGPATDGGGASSGDPAAAPPPPPPPPAPAPSGRGFPYPAPWLSYYGAARAMGDLAKVAATFRIVNVDVDPDLGNFTDQEIASLRAGGTNRVISYLNVGACENFRSYWSTAPGYTSCADNAAAQLGPYAGYPDETWMNPADASYQKLVVEWVAPRLAKAGVDGFFLDNLELVTHGTSTSNGPCDAACVQGALDVVAKLRAAFPDKLIVVQNATADVVRLGKSGGVGVATLIDGVSHEEVYAPQTDATAERELLAWKAMGLTPGGRPFWVATEDYVGACDATAAASAAYAASRANGFSPYASDKSSGQHVVCYWGF